MEKETLVLGIDLGGTDCKFGVVDPRGQIIARAKRATQAHLGPEKVISQIAETARELAAQHGVTAIGMGVPGPMSSETGVVHDAPNLPGWVNIPVRDILAKNTGLPVTLQNDANAAAFGEFWAGAGKGVQNLVLFTLGTGIGGGIILNGELFGGPDDTAGELGHMCIHFEGPPCACGNRGCLEAYASATAIRRIVSEGIAAGRSTRVKPPSRNDEAFEARTVFEAANAGDEFAREIFQNVGFALGVGAANVINIFNPDMIVYSGAMTGAGELIFAPLRETAKARAFEQPFKRVQIQVSALGTDAGIIGAAGLAMKERR